MIRKARFSDYEQIEMIMQQVQHMHVQWRPDVYCDADIVLPHDYFDKLLENDEIIVYEDDCKVIGVSIFVERTVQSGSVRVAQKTLFVDTLAVLEECRGQGVGHALFDALQEIAKQRHRDGIELQVNAKNENAIKMYKKYGFHDKSINMELYFRKE